MPRTALNLCLHYVGDGGAMWTTPDALAARLDALLAEGLTPAALSDYLDAPPDAGRFTVSFDDAHASLPGAVEVLASRGVTPTVFVPTSYVGTAPEFLDWEGLRHLRDAGWTIASHTATHPRMGWRLYDEDARRHQARLHREVTESRDAIARALGAPPALFAYPYGEAPAIARAAVEAAGYRAAFTVAGDASWDGDRLAIPRVEPPQPVSSDAPTRFSVIVPACDRARILSDVVTRLASLSYPEERYEVLVVDDGSREDLRPIFGEMPSNVRLLPSAGDATFRAGRARQRGADEARFEHLVFLDADVAVAPDFLWHLDYVHRRRADTVLLGYLSGYNLHDLGWLHTPDTIVGADLSAQPILCDRSREPTLRRCLDNLDWLEEPWTLTYTGNLSLPARTLARVGGFADEFEGWGLEDMDLGLRLHRAGARFAFSRFAVGYHVVDPSESTTRNPFRAAAPERALFAGYLDNLARLERRHADDPAVARFAARSRADVDETCGRPMTVGVELGGEARVRSPSHARLHRVQPGGVPTEELLDRVAYAKKAAAQTIYLLGGAPAEHPGLLTVLEAAAEAVSWVSMQTLVYPFATPGLAARAHEAGLRGVVALVQSLSPARYEALHGPATFEDFARGLEALEAAPLERAAHLVIGPDDVSELDATLAELARRGWALEEATILDPALDRAIRARLDPVPVRIAAPSTPSKA